VPHGSLNGTSTTCGTTRELTCDPCYDMEGNGLASCGQDENWTFNSRCTVKGVFVMSSSWLRANEFVLFLSITRLFYNKQCMLLNIFQIAESWWCHMVV